ncbi:hypothetical protein ADEAN_000800600 [Angomonas deanei]|uniref:Uncharacterized protein n=1 Tax=Angomonas deanei TaxID=59799 RepID=A0A7G2CNF8_9TRYP|nr:hypothetical protein ADEAN_000800600 [Angomonas deanei]
MHSSRKSPKPFSVPLRPPSSPNDAARLPGGVVDLASTAEPLGETGRSVGPLKESISVRQEKRKEATSTTERPSLTLPWWKRILVDLDYRRRLTELASQHYREEMKLVELQPDKISSDFGMDPKTKTVMSQYIQLPVPPLEKPNTASHSGDAGGSEAITALLERICAVRHPRSVIQNSGLAQLRRVLLLQFPPTSVVGTQLAQVEEVERYLSCRRRDSLEMSPWQKRVNKREIKKGHVHLPNLVRGSGPAQSPQEPAENSVVGPPASLSETQPAPLASDHLTRTEEWKRRQQIIEQNALLDEERIAAQEGRPVALQEEAPMEDREYEKHLPVYLDRVKEAVAAVDDGVENFYGLSHAWPTVKHFPAFQQAKENQKQNTTTSPLISFPPNGYIRVQPDPRQAMWPAGGEFDREREERQLKYSKARQQRLTNHVNDVSRKVQLLRDYGLAVDYNDFVGENSYFKSKFERQEREEASRALRGAAEPKEEDSKKSKKKLPIRLDPFALGDTHAHVPPLPLYDGPHYINFIALLPEDLMEPTQRPSVKKVPVYYGTYRQSLLLLHFKVYCRALQEEWRCRRDGGLARVMGPQQGAPTNLREDQRLEERYYASAVPQVHFPVLRVQSASPPLREERKRHTVDLLQVAPPSSTLGLIEPPPSDPSSTGYHNFQHLHHTSAIVKQVLRDIFDALPKLDEDGKETNSHLPKDRIGKDSFMQFMLNLLNLFFPTLLVDVHLDIAEEEWVYRGTTSLLSFETFFEKLFTFPFIFYRNYEQVTEEAYAEFWSLVYVCLFKTEGRSKPENTAVAVSGRKVSLLAPLSGFTNEQLAVLYSTDYHYDKAVFEYQRQAQDVLASRVERDDRMKLLPEGQRRAIAHTMARREIDTEAQKRKFLDSTLKGKESEERENTREDHEEAGSPVVEKVHRVDLVQAEKEENDRIERERAEHTRLQRLLDTSYDYQEKERRRQARFRQAVSQVETTTSSWNLHEETVYHLPEEGERELYYSVAGPAPHGGSTTLAPPRNRNYVPTEEENEMIRYLREAPDEVFEGNVSLREKFLTYKGYEAERQTLKGKLMQYNAKQSRQESDDGKSGDVLSEMIALSPCASSANTPPHTARNSQHYVSYADGSFPLYPQPSDKNDVRTFTSQPTAALLEEFYRKQRKRTSSSDDEDDEEGEETKDAEEREEREVRPATPQGGVTNEHIPSSRPATRVGAEHRVGRLGEEEPSVGRERLAPSAEETRAATAHGRHSPTTAVSEADGSREKKDYQLRLREFEKRKEKFDHLKKK